MEQEATKPERAQTIFRVAKNPDNPFVMIDRRPIENEKLSWKAKGILAYLLSRPDDWTIRFGDLVNRSPDGPYLVRQAMNELRKAGHVKVTTVREGGRIKEWIYEVFEVPHRDYQLVEKQEVKKRASTKKDLTNKDSTNTRAGEPPKEPAKKAKDYPSNVTFRAVTERWPAKVNWETVASFFERIEQRLGKFPSAEDLAPYYEAWCARGWNVFSINWLDYAARGVLPVAFAQGQATNGNSQISTSANYSPEELALAERIKAQRGNV